MRATLLPYLVWAAGLTIAYFALPGLHIVLWASLGLSSVAAIVLGVRRNRPERPLAWYLLAAAVTAFTAGDFIYNFLNSVLHQDNPFPSFADGFYLAMYPLCAAALALFIRSRTPSADHASLIDALIITAGLGLLSWTYLIEPFVSDSQLTWQQKLISVAYPLGDVLLLSMVARLLTTGGFRSRSLQMLTCATLGLLSADVMYGLIQLNGAWAVGGPVDVGWVLFYVLLGAAALDPSMGQMTTPLPPKPVDIGRARLLLIAAASLIAPGDAIVQLQLGNSQGSLVHAGFSALLFGLVMTRMSGVVHAHRRGIARERTLGTAGAALVAANDERLVAEAARTALSRLAEGQPEIGVALAQFEGGGLRNIDTEVRAPFTALEAEVARALCGSRPELVEARSVAMLLPGPVPCGSAALVLPLRSADSLIAVLLVSGDPRQLTFMQDAIQALGSQVALALQRIALGQEIQVHMVEGARQAGMAEIATNVLHNVGNVLNSVNVSAELVGQRVRGSKSAGLSKAVALIHENAADLSGFLSNDARGKALPGYLDKLAGALATERESIDEELQRLTKGVTLIREIVAAQQSLAGVCGVIESVSVSDLMEDALRMAAVPGDDDVTVTRHYPGDLLLSLDKHRVLMVLLNLMSNAAQAMTSNVNLPRQLNLGVEVTDGQVVKMTVADNGEGIPAENLTRIFVHGFTTHTDGHGFGLHSSAVAAMEMGGGLSVHSDGAGTGSVFTLEIPLDRQVVIAG